MKQMKLEKLSSAKKIIIYGYGLEGKSSEKFLRKKTEAKINIFDENIEEFRNNSNLKNYDIIVVSSGINRHKIPKNFIKKCTSNTEIFFNNLDENLRQKVIGISGTKGKSTTTKLCAEFLENAGFQVKIGGNYGIPLLDLFTDFAEKKTDFIVAELSSYQLENLRVSPHFGIFLNFFPDHLDRHKNLENYWNAKSNLWQWQNSRDFLIVPESFHDLGRNIATKSQVIGAEKIPANFFRDNSIFKASHWLENFGTVAKLGEILETEIKTFKSFDSSNYLKETTKKFAGLPHRMEFFAEKNGIKFYDDSISTNPDSTLASVNFLADNLGCIILGGQNRQQDFTMLLNKLKKLNTLVLILPTETRENLLITAKKVGLTNFIDLKKWNGFGEIAEIVFEKTNSRKVCLLSCAAPSYDLFKNFTDRGKQWQKTVTRY